MNDFNLINLLDYIDPANLSYKEWLDVGMALHHEGYAVTIWDTWSSKDSARYNAGECERKWAGFNGAKNPVTGATITQMAKDNGWVNDTPQYPSEGREIGWDEIITLRSDDNVIINPYWLEEREVIEPEDWKPAEQLIKYLETLFESSENVGYVTTSWEKDNKYLPTKGNWDRTAGELIQQLNNCNGDIGSVLGDYNPVVGAWIRFNPLDGQGCKNDNVTAWRYALVESDELEINQQYAILKELELPIACLVHSGKRSLHAIVKVDALTYEDYRKRVDFLYDICKKNGLKLDNQNRNPSRLSRMPGVMRGDKKQYLLDINIGKESWSEWREWIDGINDDLPDLENVANIWNEMPALAPEIIHGVLRKGHKMLLAGPSKAGKSFALIQLAIAIAEGKKWLTWQCTQGRVLYINLELDRASCIHRFKDVYTGLGWSPDNLTNIDIWNLRGKVLPMDKLTPKLIRRAQKGNYSTVIIDPIYKVITGDENSAEQMAMFCNQFDKICLELGVTVVYCHHHSKGSQTGKRSMDRASGSGVFSRDPDALLDMLEIEITNEAFMQLENNALAAACCEWLKGYGGWQEHASEDDILNGRYMRQLCENRAKLANNQMVVWQLQNTINKAIQKVKHQTGWQIEGTLREFPKPPNGYIWFNYPLFYSDESGVLEDLSQEEKKAANKKAWPKRGIGSSSGNNQNNNTSDYHQAKQLKAKTEFITAVNNANFGEPPTLQQMSEFTGKTIRGLRKNLDNYGYQLNAEKLVVPKVDEVDD